MNADKIKNFLYYNCIKIIAVIAVIIFVAVTVKQCQSREETDFGVMYVGYEPVSEKLISLATDIKDAGILTDVDGNGNIKLGTKAITLPASKELMIEQQVPEQIQVEIISGENLLYILPESTLISYAVDESFADISDIAEKFNVAPDSCMCYNDGRVYAVPLEGNSLLAQNGINTEGLYVAVRGYLPKDADSPFNINAIKAAEYITERNN